MKSVEVLEILESAAAEQHGLITAAQARREGVSKVQLGRLVDAGRVERLRHGVYALPSARFSPDVDVRAAWLYLDAEKFAAERLFSDSRIVISHRSAAAIHGLGSLVAQRHEFTADYRRQTSQKDIRVRRADLPSVDVVIIDGLLVTSVARTAADLAKDGIEFEYLASIVVDALQIAGVRYRDLEQRLRKWARKYGFASGAEFIDGCREQVGAEQDVEEQLSRLTPGAVEALSGLAAVGYLQGLTQGAVIDSQWYRPLFAGNEALQNLARQRPSLLSRSMSPLVLNDFASSAALTEQMQSVLERAGSVAAVQKVLRDSAVSKRLPNDLETGVIDGPVKEPDGGE